MKPKTVDDNQIIVEMLKKFLFRANGSTRSDAEAERRHNIKETEALLESLVLKTKSEATNWLHVFPRIGELGLNGFKRGPPTITLIHARVHTHGVGPSGAERGKATEFVDKKKMTTLEAVCKQNVRGEDGWKD